MPIQEQNIVFLESLVMDDVPEGGGGPSGTVIVDGQMNNVFPDISDLDRAYGNFRLRQIFLAVRTLSTDLYGGAKSVITALPEDDAIGYALFATGSPFDTRVTAANAVESYLYKGPTWPGYLNEAHIAGMRAISVIQRVDTGLPPIGRTLCLVQDEGLVTEREQYVRVTGVSVVEATFTDAQGDFTRWIVTLTLSDALRHNFNGHEARRYESSYSYTGKTRIRNTTVADATKYYGATRLAEAAAIGDLQVRAASLFTRLVPSAQTETPLVNRMLAGESVPMIASAAAPITYSPALPASIAPGGRLVLRTGAMPGTISATLGSVTVTDDGAGNAIRNGAAIGTVSYATGEILFGASAPTASGTASITYLPGVAVPQQAHTLARAVTAENRRLNWVETLDPIPAPGALEIAFMSQGNWYTLRDDGQGAIGGSDASVGAGTVSYVTGAAAITLGALPDVGSQILYTWGSPVHTAIRAAGATDAATTLRLTYTLATTPVVPGTHVASYPVNGVTRSTTDADGIISGDGVSGTINYATGEINLDFTQPPDRDGQLSNAYTWREGADLVSSSVAGGIPVVGGEIDLSAYAPFRSVGAISLNLADGTFQVEAWLTTAGAVVVLSGQVSGGRWFNTQSVGTYNASTGIVTITNPITWQRNNWVRSAWGTWLWEPDTGTVAIVSAGNIRLERDTEAWDPNAITGENVAVSTVGLVLDLATSVGDALVPGGQMFRATGKSYVDRNGTLYTDIDPATGSGTVAGSIDYSTGEARLTFWADNVAYARAVDACLTRYGNWTAIEASFRTPVAPLKPESATLTATTTDGVQITGVSDPDGLITGTWMRGSVNYEFGTGAVEIGQLVEGVWTPREVDPSTIRYNAVAYTYLPLDADVLGIDPVRLPPDGRVPIYRAGDLVLVMHAAETAPATVGNGGTIDCGRTRIAWVRVIDAAGDTVTSGYTLDRAAGVVTFSDVAGIAMPVTVRHTVADLRQVTDAQISGHLTLSRPLSHVFPADETIVASCLIHGDRRARVSAVWDQQTWDGTWVDNLVGNAATATLNTGAYPIEVTNEGAETERWILRWTSTTNVELIGERVGLVYSGPFTSNIAPINPRTREPDGSGGVPYLTIPLAANGGGWSAGNVVRITTVGAIAPILIARAIQQSDEPTGDGADGCELYALGNIDRP